jgi:glycosyltransferase involved in cell wall biosynthesis
VAGLTTGNGAMKILVLHSELGVLWGGGENFTRNLFAAFTARGHQVSAAFIADHKNRYPILLPPGIEPITIPGLWSRSLGQSTLSAIRGLISSKNGFRHQWDRIQQGLSWRTAKWHDERFQKRIMRAFASRWNTFDAVYVHSNAVLASLVSRNRPTILRLPGPLGREWEPTLKSIPVVCANGDALAQIRLFLGDHAVELPVGVDTRRFNPEPGSVRESLGWTAGDRVLGYVGRLTHLKGVALLADAFLDVSRILPQAKLILIGSGPEENYIRRRLAKQIENGTVQLRHHIDHQELPSWYRAMDLMVMPSRYENLSNAILESMACGIPFLASNIGGNAILAGMDAGWLFERELTSSLVTRIRELLTKDQEIKTRGKMAAIAARNCFSWDASADRLEKIIISRLQGETRG